MDGYTGTIVPPGMYVRALYDYAADDKTSLSFRQGDVVRVLTTLESGWWDGVINDVRGWFPSNYCVLLSSEESQRLDQGLEREMEEQEYEEFSEGDDDQDLDLQRARAEQDGFGADASTTNAFWIPQATPDGRLFYFNTLTGVSMTELPLESPVAVNETRPHDSAKSLSSEHARPPPELMMAGGFERMDDSEEDQSTSEVEEFRASSKTMPKHRRLNHLDGKSQDHPAESYAMASQDSNARSNTSASSLGMFQQSLPKNGTSKTSFVAQQQQQLPWPAETAAGNDQFVDPKSVNISWNRLLDDMRRAIERYRQAISNSDRSEFVKRAEDISDHLRLLLVGASGTTDNHSGSPSIISSNKALYPHFRDMMSRFSKLVLSSHIASADYPPPDSYSKCLQEADGVLHGVYGFVEVARQQRGEEVPRLLPGFINGAITGGSWQNNGMSVRRQSDADSSFDGQSNYGPPIETNLQLDAELLATVAELRKRVVYSIRKLEERLIVTNKVISHSKHRKLSDEICGACAKVVEQVKPWIATLESLNMVSLATQLQQNQIIDFEIHKQKVYVYVAEVIISCQAIAAPLADEWTEHRGPSLEDRINRAKSIAKEFEASTGLIGQTIQQFADVAMNTKRASVVSMQGINGGATANHNKAPSNSLKSGGRSLLGDISSAATIVSSGTSVSSTTIGNGSALTQNATRSKVGQFFGEVPQAEGATSHIDMSIPQFLRLDHEGEVQYDEKTDPPTIKGGTLTGLVEQLTRHDKFDSLFNNTFLLTYQSFTTGQELFEMLVKRWNVQPPPGLTADEFKVWREKKQGPIRFRIVNVIRTWFDSYWMEENDLEAQTLIRNVLNFVRQTIAKTKAPGIKPLEQVIEQRLRGEDTSSKRMVPNSNVEPPPPILPKNMKKLKFQDIDATELARQLTIIEHRLYCKIKPQECLNKIWQKKSHGPETQAPKEDDSAVNVKSLILHANRMTNWVAEMILSQSEPKKRASVIKHFIAIADKCLAMHNFSTLTSIISALGTAPIHRLNRTWSTVNKATITVLERHRRLMGSTKNFTEYRETLHGANPPCIPFFGVYLTDLTFIEDGITGLIKRTDLINFAKRAKTADVIREIQTYQNVPYPFKAVSELQEWIVSLMQVAPEVHNQYERSLEVEPREREDEKIARLLTESGFL